MQQLQLRCGWQSRPGQGYGFSIRTNTVVAQTCTQGESLVPSVAAPYTVVADISGSVNNNTANGTPSLAIGATVTKGNKIQQVWLGKGGVGVGDALTVNTAGTSTCGTFAATAGGFGNYDYQEFQSQFTHAGGRDLAQITGRAELTPEPEPEPEPTSVAMMVADMALIVGTAIPRRKPI